MTTHALWTGTDSNGNPASLRSDLTAWSYATGAWVQITGPAVMGLLWQATRDGYAMATAASGYWIAASESGGPPPPPPPQAT